MDLHGFIHIILINWKKILTGTIISGLIIFLILVFIFPVTYTSSATLLPPERKKDFGISNLIGSATDLNVIASNILSIASSEMYIQILKSRTVSEYVVDKLNLEKKFNTKSKNEAISKLQEMLSFDLSKEGIVKLSVDVTSQALPILTANKDSLKSDAKLIAQTLIEGLNYFNNIKLSNKSKKTRIFLESQITQTKVYLDSLETVLVNFQKKNKTFSLSDQMKAAIEAASKIKSEITRLEIELNLIKGEVTEDNKYYTSLKKQLEELRNQYNKFDTDRIDYLLSFKNAPELGQEFASLYREIRIQNEIYVMLQQMYYKEKIQENRDIPAIDILDEPVIPEIQSSPRIFFSSAVGTIFIFFGLCGFFALKDSKLRKFLNTE